VEEEEAVLDDEGVRECRRPANPPKLQLVCIVELYFNFLVKLQHKMIDKFFKSLIVEKLCLESDGCE